MFIYILSNWSTRVEWCYFLCSLGLVLTVHDRWVRALHVDLLLLNLLTGVFIDLVACISGNLIIAALNLRRCHVATWHKISLLVVNSWLHDSLLNKCSSITLWGSNLVTTLNLLEMLKLTSSSGTNWGLLIVTRAHVVSSTSTILRCSHWWLHFITSIYIVTSLNHVSSLNLGSLNNLRLILNLLVTLDLLNLLATLELAGTFSIVTTTDTSLDELSRRIMDNWAVLDLAELMILGLHIHLLRNFGRRSQRLLRWLGLHLIGVDSALRN